MSIRSFDVNGDGKLELVTGWSSGKMDARSCVTGDVTFRIQLNAGVAGIVEADYRRTGRPDLVIVSIVGEGNLIYSFIYLYYDKKINQVN